MSFSNAEAGLALICTCLPAFVGEFRHFKGRVRHAISTVLNTSSDNVMAEGEKTKPLRSFTFSTSSTRYEANDIPCNDEVELVINAQGGSIDEDDEPSHGGIMRKTEVTHVVTYAVGSENNQSKTGNR